MKIAFSKRAWERYSESMVRENAKEAYAVIVNLPVDNEIVGTSLMVFECGLSDWAKFKDAIAGGNFTEANTIFGRFKNNGMTFAQLAEDAAKGKANAVLKTENVAPKPVDMFDGMPECRLREECRILYKKCQDVVGMRNDAWSQRDELARVVRSFLADHYIPTDKPDTVCVRKSIVDEFRKALAAW